MSLPSLYDTLTRTQKPLSADPQDSIGIYCCGPTTYDVPHAGHARAALGPDVLVRFLRSQGNPVCYVRNITDVDDKILNRSKERGESPLELSARMAQVYRDQIRAIGCVDPDHEPKVSQHIPEIIALVQELLDADVAYMVDMPGGTKDVYFSVRSFPGYGKLSRRRLDELRVGARVEADEHKRDPVDFALWKGAAEGEWGWDSPFGRGRPGWHIECSAMSRRYLGHGFSLHAGGMDLIFPHHENEIAQSEAARPDAGPMAKAWMHNGFVNVDQEKMSKSLGNFVTISDVLRRNDPEGFRWFLLGVHYRGPIQFDTEKLESGRVIFPSIDEGERRTDYLFGAIERLQALAAEHNESAPAELGELTKLTEAAADAEGRAECALLEDLNTPVALATVCEICRITNELCDMAQKRRKDQGFRARAAVAAKSILAALRRVTDWLGLWQVEPATYRQRTRERRAECRGLTVSAIEAQVAEREAARRAKDFGRSDQLRDQLLSLGVTVKDTPQGATWSLDV